MNISDADIETFINRCERLNRKVSAMPELGENYQVGHTFFAEVVDIFKSLKGVHSGRLYFLNQPVTILWEIALSQFFRHSWAIWMSILRDKIRIAKSNVEWLNH